MTSQWPRWSLKSPASWLFTVLFIQTQIKENIKAPRHWHLCREFTGNGEFPAQRASYAENISIWWHHHDDPMVVYWPSRSRPDQSLWSSFHLEGRGFLWSYLLKGWWLIPVIQSLLITLLLPNTMTFLSFTFELCDIPSVVLKNDNAVW